MRSKEVEEAINFLIDTDFDPLEYEMGVNAIDTVLIYIKELENNSISKETLRKIKANTDTYRDFAEEVLKLL